MYVIIKNYINIVRLAEASGDYGVISTVDRLLCTGVEAIRFHPYYLVILLLVWLTDGEAEVTVNSCCWMSIIRFSSCMVRFNEASLNSESFFRNDLDCVRLLDSEAELSIGNWQEKCTGEETEDHDGEEGEDQANNDSEDDEE